jgi:APA family basic amino acid/polyamine antiporter
MVSGRGGKLRRQLGLGDSVMIMVGTVLGAGIYVTGGIIAQYIPSPVLLLAAWLVGGLITLAGALAYAELGAAMPEAGGIYVYLKKAYGSLTAFLFGWISFLVCGTGVIAGLAVAFADYFSYFFPGLSFQHVIWTANLDIFGFPVEYSLSAGRLVGASAIIFLSIMNGIGTHLGKGIQNIFTVIKITAITALIVLGFATGKGQPVQFTLNPPGWSFGSLVSGFGMALIGVSWTFGGWNSVNFIAGEIKNPQRNLKLTLIWGTVFISFLYLLVNYVYLYALPIDQMSGVVRIAEKASTALFGVATASIISAVIMVSTFGALNGCILTSPRVYYAMARDGIFFKQVARIHPTFQTPLFSIVLQAAWAIVLTLTGTFEQLLTYTIFIFILFNAITALSVITLRKKLPDLPRPYKTWGYPYVPAIFIIASLGILLNTLMEKPLESLLGLTITAIGIPVYFYWNKIKKSGTNGKHPDKA